MLGWEEGGGVGWGLCLLEVGWLRDRVLLVVDCLIDG